MLTENITKTINGAKIILETLKNLGVDTVFGYPGGIVLKVYDELYKQQSIKHILVRHEQSAVHAAEGYARTNGKCGVVLVTSGPGATNTITGLMNAYIDGSPLIILTGQVCANSMGKDSFQEANICDIAKTCTKKVFQVNDITQLQRTIEEAHRIAMEGKKGPVLIDLVNDIFTQSGEYKTPEPKVSITIPHNESTPDKIINIINNSKKPVIVIGGGCNQIKNKNLLKSFLDKTNIPYTSTMMGLGSFNRNENYYGMIGIFGDKSANEIFKASDTVISLGARLNDRISCVLQLKNIIQIDINPNEICKNFVPKASLTIDIEDFLNSVDGKISDFSQWNINAKSFKKLNKENRKTSNLIHSFEIMQKLNEYTKDKDVIFTSEVGQHQLWAVKNLEINPDRRILVSGGTGTMGFGFPGSIGAAIANPNRTVICITGDGSFQMSLQELAVCKDYGLNIKIIVLNNGYLGMVRQLQEKNCEERYSQTQISNPDYMELAKSYGIKASRALSSKQIDSVLSDAFSTNETYIAEFVTEPMETV